MNRRVRAQRPNPNVQAKHSPDAVEAARSMRAMRAVDVLGVQAAAGNRAARTALQRSMQVGAAGDAHEVEADAVAREIVAAGPASAQREAVEEEELQAKHIERAGLDEEEPLQAKHIERAGLEEEEPLQAKHIERAGLEEEEPLQAKHIERAGVEEEELQAKHLQRDAAPEVGMEGGSVSAETSHMVERAAGGGRPLDAGVKTEMETQFGRDFSAVRVHEGAEASELNTRLSARAFTTGSDIFVGQGGLNAGTRGGKELLAHELTHVVQQGAAPAGGAARKTGRTPRIRP